MNHAERGLLMDLRHALLHLHKTLLDWERVGYERLHGRVSSQQLLQAVFADPQFVWLRPFSELIVHIDETLEHETPEAPADMPAILDRARTLVTPAEPADASAQRYRDALQAHPDAVLAHRGVTVLLKPPKPH
ncbi:MAG: hypothetical protein FJW14_13725 [Acidimicrobiia bacterium]|nr:hypothetical protein [Acidimicrobiia bacterium]